jgi:hypothetical protein
MLACLGCSRFFNLLFIRTGREVKSSSSQTEAFFEAALASLVIRV